MNICVVTGSRADYERLPRLLRVLDAEPDINLVVLACGMHLSPEYGLSIEQIRDDGFSLLPPVEMLISSSTGVGMSKSIGVGVLGIADCLDRERPDVVMVLGDRFEMLAVATVCVCQGIPLAHVCGGEITEGAIDDQVRHMLTKAAHFHYVAHPLYGQRVGLMGEEPWRICVSGSPAIDTLRDVDYMPKQELESDLGVDLDKSTALVTYHPETLGDVSMEEQISGLVENLAVTDLQCVITYPNADAGSQAIICGFKELEAAFPERIVFRPNLGRRRFLSLLKHVEMMVGNSSSGIVEAPSFNVPVVNIGNRQAGRIFGQNIVPSGHSFESIRDAISVARSIDVTDSVNPYGDMMASERIVEHLRKVFSERSLSEILMKKFNDVGVE